MVPTPLTPIAKLLEKAADLQPVQKRYPLVQKCGEDFIGRVSPGLKKTASPGEDEDFVDPYHVSGSAGSSSSVQLVNAAEEVSPEAIAETIRKYGILKSLGYLSYKSESSISLTVPVPPARAVRNWERALLLLPSFSSVSEDDYI